MIAKILKKIEKQLYKRNFQSSFIRQILSILLLLNCVSFCFGVLLAFVTLWPLYFWVGLALASCSFWHIARFAQKSIFATFTPALAIKLSFGFMLRFGITAIILFLLIVWLHAPIAPLVAGLTVCMIVITVWGLLKFSTNPV